MAKGFQALRSALSSLAGQFLEERMFLRVAPDTLLCRLTKGAFNGNKEGHPVFVLKKKSESFIGCPCSTKCQNVSYIPQGVPLEGSEPPYHMDKTSYIIHHYPFVMPKDNSDYAELWESIHVRGIVSKDAIVGTQWKSWSSIFYNDKNKR